MFKNKSKKDDFKVKNEASRQKARAFVRHPYFGFFLLGLILVIVLLLYSAGAVPISTVRAFGQTLIYFVIGLGFTLLLGYSGLASLGTAGFVGLGSYAVGYFLKSAGLPMLLSFILAIIIAILIGTIVGFISLRIEGMYLAIITLGLSEILNEVFKNAVSITNGVNGLSLGIPKVFSVVKTDRVMFPFAVIIVVTVIAMIATLNIINSPIGRAMLSMKNSTSAAQSMGISLLKYRLLAFILSTVFAAIGGGLYMIFYQFSIPTTWNLSLSLNILAAVVVGGAKSIWGVFLGSFVIFGLDLAILKRIDFFIRFPNAALIFNGILIILIVMFYPGGLVRMFQSGYNKIKVSINNSKERQRRGKYGEDSDYPTDQQAFINQQAQKVGR